MTPRLVVRYKLDDRNMVYGTISRGYKAGGFQGQADNGASAAVPYDPEFVTNYEVGGKFPSSIAVSRPMSPPSS